MGTFTPVHPSDTDEARWRRAKELLARLLNLPVGFKEAELDREFASYGGERKLQVELYDAMLLLEQQLALGHGVPDGLNLIASEFVHGDESYRLGPAVALLLRLFEGGKTVSVDSAIDWIWPVWGPQEDEQQDEQEDDGPPIKSLYSRTNRFLKDKELGMIRREGEWLRFYPPSPPKLATKK